MSSRVYCTCPEPLTRRPDRKSSEPSGRFLYCADCHERLSPENAADEEAEAFYESNDVGGSPAYSDGEYDESATSEFSFSTGREFIRKIIESFKTFLAS